MRAMVVWDITVVHVSDLSVWRNTYATVAVASTSGTSRELECGREIGRQRGGRKRARGARRSPRLHHIVDFGPCNNTLRTANRGTIVVLVVPCVLRDRLIFYVLPAGSDSGNCWCCGSVTHELLVVRSFWAAGKSMLVPRHTSGLREASAQAERLEKTRGGQSGGQ